MQKEKEENKTVQTEPSLGYLHKAPSLGLHGATKTQGPVVFPISSVKAQLMEQI